MISYISSSVDSGRGLNLHSRILFLVNSSDMHKKGEIPDTNSYKMHPSDHISAGKLYCFPSIISGAVEINVPH